ncbi:MAG: hypothetical protein ACJ735_01340 [Actinomycetes bacterium]
MLVGAVVCPHPPLLFPDLAGRAAPELDALRAACDAAVTTLLGTRPDVVIVAAAEDPAEGTGGTTVGFGVPMRVGTGAPTLPLPHTVGCWLLDRAGWTGRRHYVGPAADDAIRAVDGRVALLVLGDASARRTEKAPGYLDPRAQDFDAAVAAALRAGPAALGALDGSLAAELLVAGWPAWQLLARVSADAQWDTRVTYDDAPYGVGYLVAEWTRR